MIRTIRQSLRSIRYHSARRERTRWTRAMDAALVASFLLCVPAAFLSATLVRRDALQVVFGQIVPRLDGTMNAMLLDEASPSVSWGQAGSIEFELRLGQEDLGFPFVIREDLLPVAVWVAPYPGAPRLQAADPATQAVELDAIAHAVDRAGDPALAESFHAKGRRSRVVWTGLVASIPAWWILLLLIAAIGIQLARLATAVATRYSTGRRWSRIRRGVCPSCGYDTRGSLFSERCPECGELLE
ncbi:MAG: hypothetical protein KDA22_05110 [Phycisphaerales bacterium]|nr:hypothetical protein [Phycisphaerales bacterium]